MRKKNLTLFIYAKRRQIIFNNPFVLFFEALRHISNSTPAVNSELYSLNYSAISTYVSIDWIEKKFPEILLYSPRSFRILLLLLEESGFFLVKSMVVNGMCPSRLFSSDFFFFLIYVFECCPKVGPSTDRKLPLLQEELWLTELGIEMSMKANRKIKTVNNKMF